MALAGPDQGLMGPPAQASFRPGDLNCFDDLHGGDAVLAVLAVGACASVGRGLSRSKTVLALRRGGRQRWVEDGQSRSRPPHCTQPSWPLPPARLKSWALRSPSSW